MDYCGTQGNDKHPPNTEKLEFKKFHRICDSVFHSFYENEIVPEKKSASVLSKEDKNMLWTLGIPNINNPVEFQRAVFFYLGKVCYLRLNCYSFLGIPIQSLRTQLQK